MDTLDTKAIDMISSENQPKRTTTSDEDFTEEHYRQLLRAAKVSYRFVTYEAIPWNTRFILWRHDIDYSINRAAALASIEANEGVTSTYFVNPCSEFYNPFEPGQALLLKHILGLGHRLGLHFDSAFHGIRDEETLHRTVAQERRWLEEAFDVRPAVFSFHNPSAAHMQFDADSYGGLINCYSRQFKEQIPYCSDSNGYWRYRRLHDVLAEATDPCLQVLTHPGWWQEKPMPPRQRIFRCAYSRAGATMRSYDDGLRSHGRINHLGPAAGLAFLRELLQPEQFELCDYLWNASQYQVLFLELWRMLSSQVSRLCQAQNPNVTYSANVARWDQFENTFAITWQSVTGMDKDRCLTLSQQMQQLVAGEVLASVIASKACLELLDAIKALACWGQAHPVASSGLTSDRRDITLKHSS